MADQTSNYYIGYLGVASALCFATWGAAYATYKSASGIFNLGTSEHPSTDDQDRELLTKNNKESNDSINYQGKRMPKNQYIDLSQKQNNTRYVMPSFIPIIMAGVLAIYGLIIGVILSKKVTAENYSAHAAYSHLASGLSVGLTCLVSGYGIGSIAYNGITAISKQAKLFVPMVCMLIFTQAIALYGLILALILQAE